MSSDIPSADVALARESDQRRIWPDELAFDRSVYGARLDGVREHMERSGLGAALIFDPENMFWLTGYQTIGYFTFQAMLVTLKARPALITRVVNRDLALALPTIERVVPIHDTDEPMAVLASAVDALGMARVGFEPSSRYLSVADYFALTERVGTTLVPYTAPIEEGRRIKSAAELDRMRQAARAVERGMDDALNAIAPGRTDNDVAAALHAGCIAAGSEYIGHPPMVVSGARSALCFALWRRKTIERGDVVLIEGAAAIDRYHVMMSRSAVVGRPTDEQKATADALIEMLETATEAIQPGVSAGAVDHICRERIAQRGYGKYFKSRAAYGIGIGFPPNWSEGHIYAIRPDDPLVLQENMTFHVIPTIFREDFGMAISDSVCVTAGGCEVLTHYPRDLKVVD